MSPRTITMTDGLQAYLIAHGTREHPVQLALRKQTAPLPMAVMQTAPEQGALIALLLQLQNAKRTIDVGVFTGYSALSAALALPDDGYVLACDVDSEWTAMAQKAWQEAKVANKVELVIAPAADTLQARCERQDEVGSYDFAMIDADKANYQTYYELCLKLLKPGGLLALDNVLWGGAVLDKENADEDTRAIQAINKVIHTDPRVDMVMLPVGDGLTLARKRPRR